MFHAILCPSSIPLTTLILPQDPCFVGASYGGLLRLFIVDMSRRQQSENHVQIACVSIAFLQTSIHICEMKYRELIGSYKVHVPNTNIPIIWTHVVEWYVRCGSKNIHQKDMYLM
jgi:hypothetical protein